MRTAQPHIFAIGDIVGQPMLAHKATHEGKVAAARSARSTRGSSRRSPTPIRKSPGSASPRPRPRRRGSTTRRAASRGRRADARWRKAGTRASPSCSSIR
jgi:dihydrolipoamide dehydrogenase